LRLSDYSITVNQVMVVTVKRSKWWLQLNHYHFTKRQDLGP